MRRALRCVREARRRLFRLASVRALSRIEPHGPSCAAIRTWTAAACSSHSIATATTTASAILIILTPVSTRAVLAGTSFAYEEDAFGQMKPIEAAADVPFSHRVGPGRYSPVTDISSAMPYARRVDFSRGSGRSIRPNSGGAPALQPPTEKRALGATPAPRICRPSAD